MSAQSILPEFKWPSNLAEKRYGFDEGLKNNLTDAFIRISALYDKGEITSIQFLKQGKKLTPERFLVGFKEGEIKIKIPIAITVWLGPTSAGKLFVVVLTKKVVGGGLERLVTRGWCLSDGMPFVKKRINGGFEREIYLMLAGKNLPGLPSEFYLRTVPGKIQLIEREEDETLEEAVVWDIFQDLRIKHLVVKTLLQALEFFHSQNLAHSDLKGSNVLVSKVGTHVAIKLIDFGFTGVLKKATRSEHLPPERISFYRVINRTTPETIAKFNEKYGIAYDLWGMGCLILLILNQKKRFPDFIDVSQKLADAWSGDPIYQQPMVSQEKIEADFAHEKSELDPSYGPLLDLASKLMRADPLERMSCKEAITFLEELNKNSRIFDPAI